MRIIIAGSRTIDQVGFDQVISQCTWATEAESIVSGGALGVDQLAEAWASTNGVPVIRYNPDWKRFGRGAGIIRNRTMVENADALLAIWDGQSRGTKQIIQYAQAQGLRVEVFCPRLGNNGPIQI
jgi:hypothetical protein